MRWRRALVWAVLLNELRGAVLVALTWPAWWPVVRAAWAPVLHALGR